MELKLICGPAPHIRDNSSVRAIMLDVIIALMPAFIGSIIIFGTRSLLITISAILGAVLSEAIVQALRRVPITISDCSALITGILLAFNLPPGVPLWLPFVGSAFGIIFAKQLFGGLGYNPMNPALIGRAFLMLSWPVHMTTDWIAPEYGTLSGTNAITTATPLTALKMAGKIISDPNSSILQIQTAKANLEALSAGYWNYFVGTRGGCIGETSALLLFLGGIYLIIRRVIDWRIPLVYIATTGILGWVFGGFYGLFSGDALFYILTGGLFLGAFFMATDMVTIPITAKGRVLFAFGCGLFTVIIRRWGGYPEGVCYSILLMNILTPLIDRWIRPRILGGI